MMMPNRSYSATSSYRYGFNGKENDNEVKGEGNEQDYGMRIYDPRVGRFLSVDPLIHDYSELTPYQFASNRPIGAIDIDGLESKDLERELEPVRRQRKMESTFGIVHEETKGAKAVGTFVKYSLGATVLAPVIAEAPIFITTNAARLFWWAAANPTTASGVAFSIVVAATGYEGPDLPGPADDFGRMGRKVYDKLISSGVNSDNALGQAARNSYNAIINTIDEEIKGLSTLETKAQKAFQIRNNAKEFARELSGPNNKKAAEALSKKTYGNEAGPTFDELYKKYYEEATKNGAKEADAKNKTYQGIIDASKRPNEEINKTFGVNK